jgi:hypothetical protein
MEPKRSVHPNIPAISKLLDIVVLILLLVLFFGFLAFDYELLGIHEQIIPIPYESEIYFEMLLWILFSVLVFDLWLKYLMAGKGFRVFLRH